MTTTTRLAPFRLAAALGLLLGANWCAAADDDVKAGGAAAAPTPEWIWLSKSAADGEVAYFRKEFDVPGDVKSARLFASCDNGMTVYLNGTEVAASDAWERPARADVAKALKKGRNVLAVRGKNNDGVAALVARLTITLAEGDRKLSIVTDKTWLAAADEAAGWQNVDHKPAAAWKEPVALGKLGVEPWGDLAAAAVPLPRRAAARPARRRRPRRSSCSPASRPSGCTACRASRARGSA
jgi:hypothetical protein